MINAPRSVQPRFVTLDGLRGIAALAVITDHVYSPTLSGFFGSRYLAVDFFFVLSGFVIAHVYGERLASGMSWWQFMRARAIRLYPLYFAGLAMGVSLTVLMAAKHWIDVEGWRVATATGLGLFMLPTPSALAPNPYNVFPFDGPAWSLFFELVANAAFALVLLRLNTKQLAAILAVSAVGLIAVVSHFGVLMSGYNEASFIGGFPRVFYGFFAGVLVYRLHTHVRLPAPPAWVAAALLVFLLAMPGEGLWRAIYDAAAAIVIFPLFVLWVANSPISGVSARLAAGMGLISYGVYILHVPVRDWLRVTTGVLAPGWEMPGALNVILVAILAVAGTAALHVLYDAPVRRWLSRPRRTAQA